MLTTPKLYCPLCGLALTVIKPIAKSRYGDQVTYYCMCGSGTADLIVRRGKIYSVTIRDHPNQPEFRVLGGMSRDMYRL